MLFCLKNILYNCSSFIFIYCSLFYSPAYDLYWWICHAVCDECVFLMLLDSIFYHYQLGQLAEYCFLYPYWIFDCMFCQLLRELKSQPYNFLDFLFLFNCVSFGFIYFWACSLNVYTVRVVISSYKLTPLLLWNNPHISGNIPCSKVYIVWF